MSVRGLVSLVLMPLHAGVRLVEAVLFMLVRWYDQYLYTPLQLALWPLVHAVPRSVTVDGRTITVFTANIVSWARTFLVVPIAITLKYQYHWTGFWLVILHDFLDHLDGIVAKVQKEKYGPVDDPIVGGFMDAFCDKIVNVLSLWTILTVTDFSHMSLLQSTVFISACAIIIAYEFTLGVVRVQDFFRAYYLRKFKQIDTSSSKSSTAAVMEGKLKEKLESMGIAALCVAQASVIPLASTAGAVGITCLYLSVRLAHSSLMSKLEVRSAHFRSQAHASDDEDEKKEVEDEFDDNEIKCKELKTLQYPREQSLSLSDSTLDIYKDTEVHNNKSDHHINSSLHRRLSIPELYNDVMLDSRAERVYTIGCFDLFHHGHVTLLKRMKTFGKKVIVGIHDSRSIYRLKNRVPIDSTITRMRNVKQFADEVFCVAGTDPTPFIDSIFDRNCPGSAVYIRGDDMKEFPARNLCEKLMTVKFLPYTAGVSTTKLRKDLFNSSHYDIRLDDADCMFY